MNNCQAYRIYDLSNLFVSSVPEMRRNEDGSERPFGMSTITNVFDSRLHVAFSALTPLDGRQEGYAACRKWRMVEVGTG